MFALLPTSPLYLIKQQKPSLAFSSQNLFPVHSLIRNDHRAMMIMTILNDSLNRNLVWHFHLKICFECTGRALQMHLSIWEPHLSFTPSQNDSSALNIAPQSILRFFFTFYWIVSSMEWRNWMRKWKIKNINFISSFNISSFQFSIDG